MEIRTDLMDAHLYAFKRFEVLLLLLSGVLLQFRISVLCAVFIPYFHLVSLKVCSSRNTWSKRIFPKLKAGCAALSCQEPAG